MTREEFQAVVGEISAYFGEKTFQPRMSGILWQILSPLSVGEGRRVVEQLVETSTRAPTPAQVRQVALPFTRKNDEEKKRARIAALAPCHVCGGSGMMLALLKENPVYEYSFTCGHCDAAATRGYTRLPVWDDAAEQKYLKVSLRMDSHRGAAEVRNAEFAKRHPPKAKRGIRDIHQEELARREEQELEGHPGDGAGYPGSPAGSDAPQMAEGPPVINGEPGGEARPDAEPDLEDCPF